MALRVWLPLNKDLRNQGLSDVAVTNNGATFSDGCANFISDNGINTNVLVPMMEHTTRLSISFWMNPGAFDGSEHNLVGTTDWSWLLSYNNSSLIFRQWNSNGSSSSSATDAIQWIYGTGISANLWNFITLTWDGNNCKGYINGSQVFIRTNTGTITHRTITNTSGFWLKLAGGIFKSSTTGFNGSMYDFRIYDHALSKKEVTELARGCVLHYPCNDINSQVLNNVFSYPTFNTSNSNGGWSHWGNTGYHAEYSQNTNKDYIYNKSNTYSHYVKCYSDSPVSYICYQSPAFDGGYRSVQAIIKMEDKSVPDTSKINIYFNAGVGSAPPMQYIPLGDDFYLIKREGFQQDGSNDLVDISVTPGNAVYISEAYCENNMQVCSNIFHTGTYQLKDMSGFDNHSLITGSLPLVTTPKSPRYDKCLDIKQETITKYIAEIDGDKCISCSICQEYCNYDAIVFNEQTRLYEIDANKCTGCTDCFLCDCPTGALHNNLVPVTVEQHNYVQSTLSAVQTYSASFWVYIGASFPTTSGVNQLVLFSNANSDLAFGFWGGTSCSLRKYHSNSIVCDYTINNKVKYNSWNHFVCNNNSSTTELYINGTKITGASGLGFGVSHSGFILGDNGNGSRFNGKISDFRLFSRVLTQADVDDLYQTGCAIDKNQNLYCYELVEKSIDDETNLIYNGQMAHGMDGYATLIAENQQTIDTSDKPGGCTASYVCNTDTINPWAGGGRKGIVPVIPYINTDTYKLSYKFKDNGSTRSTKYMCIMPYDNKGKFIDTDETNKYQGNITTLAQDLKNGDTIVYLTSTTNWVADTTYRNLGIIESAAYGDDRALYRQAIAQNGVNASNNTVTLSSSWNGGTYKAGSKVREFSAGNTYLYPNAWSDNPTTWTYKEKEFAKSWESRLPFSYFLGIGPMYVKGKFADLRFENLSREQKRIPNGTDTIPLFITSAYGNIDNYEETITDIKKSGILDTGMLTTGFLPVRYIRDWCNGNTLNTKNHWCEIQAFDRWGRNVAYAADGSLPSGFKINTGSLTDSRYGLNADNNTTYKPMHAVTIGILNSNYIDSRTEGLLSITIDMGIIHYIDKIKVWHYYPDSRTYHGTKTEVSADGVNWTTVFDSTLEGEYAETIAGHTITFDKQGVYNYNVRLRKGGEILTSNEIIEI